MKIGVYLKKMDWGDPHVASDRIRGQWIMKFCPEMQEWRPGQSYDAVIFHNLTQQIEKTSGLKILDVCDRIWHEPAELQKFARSVDGIVTCTDALRQEVRKIVDKPTCVIGDGHYFPHYESRLPNPHDKPARSVVWFGYADNAGKLAALFPQLVARGLQIKFISDRNPFPGATSLHFCKWNVDTYVQEVSKADFAVLPVNKPYGSNNREITALLCGIPVAKTAADIDRLISPEERRREMERAPEIVSHYDAKDRAREYMEWINLLRSGKGPVASSSPGPSEVVAYTAICGGYEPARSDVLVFGDSPTGKFKNPVMNAKAPKILPHRFVDAPFRIWVDGNIYLNRPPVDLVADLLQGYDIAVFRHPWRKCLYDEHEPARERLAPEMRPLIDEQARRYEREGMPRNFGLAECGVILSRANDATREFFDRWWAEVCRFSPRDQMSFPYVWWRMGSRIKVRLLEAKTRFGDGFRYVERKK